VLQTNPSSSQPFTTVLVFLKDLAAPLVLYMPNPTQLYEQLKGRLKQASAIAPQWVELETVGPLKHVCFWDTALIGVALQAEPSTQLQRSEVGSSSTSLASAKVSNANSTVAGGEKQSVGMTASGYNKGQGPQLPAAIVQQALQRQQQQ
jgi:hypothetical protein